jgi:lysophospholipase L1-like esterase
LVRYQRVVAELAQRHRALHLRTQHAFARVMAHRAPGLLAPEPVHPHPAGHALIAQALYELLATGR